MIWWASTLSSTNLRGLLKLETQVECFRALSVYWRLSQRHSVITTHFIADCLGFWFKIHRGRKNTVMLSQWRNRKLSIPAEFLATTTPKQPRLISLWDESSWNPTTRSSVFRHIVRPVASSRRQSIRWRRNPLRSNFSPTATWRQQIWCPATTSSMTSSKGIANTPLISTRAGLVLRLCLNCAEFITSCIGTMSKMTTNRRCRKWWHAAWTCYPRLLNLQISNERINLCCRRYSFIWPRTTSIPWEKSSNSWSRLNEDCQLWRCTARVTDFWRDSWSRASLNWIR